MKNPKRLIFSISITAVFTAISTILYTIPIFSFNIPIFPGFLQFHLDEIPLFVVGYAAGPAWAAFAIVIKTVIKLPMTTTLAVGEVCDFILTLLFILPSAILYKYKKTIPWFILGLTIGVVLQMTGAALLNMFVLLPWYLKVFEMEEESLLGMIQSLNPNVVDLKGTYMLFVTLPFNALKNAMVIGGTVVSFIPLRVLINKYNKQEAN